MSSIALVNISRCFKCVNNPFCNPERPATPVANQPAVKEPDWSRWNCTVFSPHWGEVNSPQIDWNPMEISLAPQLDLWPFHPDYSVSVHSSSSYHIVLFGLNGCADQSVDADQWSRMFLIYVSEWYSLFLTLSVSVTLSPCYRFCLRNAWRRWRSLLSLNLLDVYWCTFFLLVTQFFTLFCLAASSH